MQLSTRMVDDLIERYETRLVEPGCSPGSGRWGVLLSLPGDISAVFPYLNAEHTTALYDPENRILIIREPAQAYAFRPREIRIARAEEQSHARLAAAEIVARVNRIWRERESITPLFTERKHVSVIDIFKLLPKTNCRKCGYLTCLAYAADLRQGAAGLTDCPLLDRPEYAENRQSLGGLFIREP
jgi:ArsR family metal-binding transcriptional regulator